MGLPPNSPDEMVSQRLLEQRLEVAGALAINLEESRWALTRKDAEAIARGAAHQAELCRQWRSLEDRLRGQSCGEGRTISLNPECGSEAEQLARLDLEWQELRKRIQYLTRVHSSLLRHMQRSLGILQRVIGRHAPTYGPVHLSQPAGADGWERGAGV